MATTTKQHDEYDAADRAREILRTIDVLDCSTSTYVKESLRLAIDAEQQSNAAACSNSIEQYRSKIAIDAMVDGHMLLIGEV